MRQLLHLIFFLMTASAANAASDSELAPAYAAQFKQAVDLLNGYRGESASLQLAEKKLERLLKKYPNFAPAYRELARHAIMRGQINSRRFQLGSLPTADAFIAKSLELDPSFAEAFVLRGHLYRLMGRPAEAYAALQKAEQLGTGDPWLQNNWADLLHDEGKYDEAARRYRNVIESKTPNNKAMMAALGGLAKYYAAVGKLDQADDMYRRQIELEPRSAWAYGNYAAFLLCHRDDYDQTIERSRQALVIMDYGVGRYWLAAGLYRKWAAAVLAGSPEKGRQYYIEARGLHPNPHEIAQAAARCPSLGTIGEALRKSPSEPQPGTQANRIDANVLS